jgi:hypothetical protein
MRPATELPDLSAHLPVNFYGLMRPNRTSLAERAHQVDKIGKSDALSH